jgi:hypothetical protein
MATQDRAVAVAEMQPAAKEDDKPKPAAGVKHEPAEGNRIIRLPDW